MESIKETELNLQREVVTTVPNTWLVEAVNPSTGEKKMIDIANYASVVAEQIKANSKLSLQSVLLTMPAEKGYWRKIAEFSQTQSGRLVAIFSAARVESAPNAHIAILDLNVFRATVYGKLHTLVGDNVLKLYYKNTGDKTILYATGDTTYCRMGISILMAYGTTFAIEASELIDESATVIQ